MTPSSVAPGVQTSAPQDFANPTSVPTAEPGFEAELSLALLGQPAPTEAATDEEIGPEMPIVAAEVGLQNLPPVLTWLPTLAANFSTPTDAQAPILQTLEGVGLPKAVAIAATVAAPPQIPPADQVAVTMSLPGPTGTASMTIEHLPLDAAPAFTAAASSGPAAAQASATPSATQLQEAQGAAITPEPLAWTSSKEPTQGPGVPSPAQQGQALTEATQQTPAANASQTTQPQPVVTTEGMANASVVAAAQTAQREAQPKRSPNAAASSQTTETGEAVHTAARMDLRAEQAPAPVDAPSTPTTAQGISATMSTQAAESAVTQDAIANSAATDSQARQTAEAKAAWAPDDAVEPVSHGAPRLGIEEGPDAEPLMAKAATESKAPGSAAGPSTLEGASAVDRPTSASGAGVSVPAPSAAGVIPTPVAPAAPATVDVSLPIKPHLVSLETGAVQVEILRMARDGGGQITLELTPPDQGRYRLDLRIDELGQATLVVDGASESTRTRLEMGESALREQFSHLGLQLNLQLRSSQGEHRHEPDLTHASSSSNESDAQSPTALAAPGRRSTALDLDRGLVRLYA